MEITANSGQVEIIDSFGRVYLYTHSHGKTLVSDVYEALNTRKDGMMLIILLKLFSVTCFLLNAGKMTKGLELVHSYMLM